MIIIVLISSLLVALVTGTGNDPNCGIKGPTPPSTLTPIFGSPRIINGDDALPGEFPWQCSIRFSSNSLHCGGSLINSRFILTAGHCVDTKHQFTVVCGGNTFLTPSKTEVRAKVVKQIRHPLYKHEDHHSQNDVALMKLDRDFNLSQPTLGSVCLPKANEPVDSLAGSYAIATGWGETVKNPFSPDNLQKASLNIWKQSNCVKTYANSVNLPTNITVADICMGGQGKSTCFGDSGGPLVHFNKVTKRWTNYGVTSFAASCFGPEPDVDARVSTFVNWIWDTVATNLE